MKNKFLLPLILFLLVVSDARSQTRTNLEVIRSLIEKSVVHCGQLSKEIKPASVSVITSQPLEIFKPEILENFSRSGRVYSAEAKSSDLITYTLISARVEYADSFSDGFFGDMLVERNVNISGVVEIKDPEKALKPFEFTESLKDTVKLEEIPKIEDKSIPFTQAAVPSQSLLSTFWEPILVIGTLIATVILLFTVRSK